MKLRKMCTVLALAGGTLVASALSADGQDGGLIGKRYAGADFAYAKYHSSRFDDALLGGAVYNMPVAPNIDAMFNYGLTHLTGPSLSRVENELSASLVTYAQDEYGKPFFTATLGEAWQTTKSFGNQLSDSSAIWGLGAGLEVPFMGDSALTYSLNYVDGFRGSAINRAWKYGIQLNHWITPRIAGVAAFTYNVVKHMPNSMQFTVGARYTF